LTEKKVLKTGDLSGGMMGLISITQAEREIALAFGDAEIHILFRN